MIYNISYRDREIIREINTTIGKPFGVIERFKMKGIGSPRFILNSASNDVAKRLPPDESMVKVSIELRPKGIIVHINKRASRLSWVIPYYCLSLFSSEHLGIHSTGHFLKIKHDDLYNKSVSFIQKVMTCKAHYSDQIRPE